MKTEMLVLEVVPATPHFFFSLPHLRRLRRLARVRRAQLGLTFDAPVATWEDEGGRVPTAAANS